MKAWEDEGVEQWGRSRVDQARDDCGSDTAINSMEIGYRDDGECQIMQRLDSASYA